MNIASLKKLLDACWLSKRAVETLPELPRGMKPRHIHVLDAIYEMQMKRGLCRVSDVSTKLNITMPSVTKLIQELEALNMVEKYTDKGDKRIALLKLREAGKACLKCYVTDYQGEWLTELTEISDERVDDVILVLETLWGTMPKHIHPNSE
jgi:DNA-binding MarR family transcriptional regulator